MRESDAHAEQDDESKPDWDAYRRHCVDVGARPNMPGFQAWQRNHTPNGDAA